MAWSPEPRQRERSEPRSCEPWASQIVEQALSDFIERFDQSCALAARRDDQAQGRWTRAFEGHDLEASLGPDARAIEALHRALELALAQDPESLRALERWARDWDVLLSELEHLSASQIEALRWSATWAQQLRAALPEPYATLLIHGRLTC